MSIRQIIQLGHPKLKTINKKISSFTSTKTKNLILDLIDIMYKVDLIGIAAPQIGENYIIFVTHPRSTKARKLPKEDKLRIYINPTISNFSKNMSIIYEGCGSVVDGKLFGPVERPKELTVVAFNKKGQKFQLTCDGILARVIQHEMDHLMGMEFTQKISDYTKLMVKEHYIKNIKTSKTQLVNSKITKIEYKKF